ncbi:MAG TPA: hypothetical protein PL193_02830 [Xanthobacteraceae bacterium]|nr:hypothetical protein [Xanthobacteraceae bacterium]
MRTIPTAEMFRALARWTEEAKLTKSSAPPSLEPILSDLHNSGIRNAAEADMDSIKVVAFDIKGEGKLGVKTRHVLPVHFAILRALEMVPGMKLTLGDDTHKAQDKAKGQPRENSELIYHLVLIWRRANKSKKRVKVDRVLFNAPPNASIHERRTGDHHFIIPSNFVLLRIRRAEDLMTQESFLRAAEVALESSSSSVDFSKEEFINLLGNLFALGDKWHWKELRDRTSEDQVYYRGDNV